MVTAPTKKPVSPPKPTPAIIVNASTGLNCGNIKKAALPAMAMAQRVAISTSSLAFGFLPSNTRKNGIMHSIKTANAVI